MGNVGIWCHQTQPECLVKCSGIGVEEGWCLMVLYQLLLPECSHEKGLLPSA